MKRTLLTLIGLILLATSHLVMAVQPVESFSRLPKYKSPKLSPDGVKVAVVVNVQQEGGGMAVLSVLDGEKGSFKYLLKSDNEEVKINWYNWANEKTLLVSARFAGKRYGTDTAETRLFAVDVEEEKPELRLLIKPRGGVRNQHISQFQDKIIDYLPGDDDHVLIALDLDKATQPSVYKLNIYTKKLSRLEKGKRKVRTWMTDQQSNLRLGITLDYKKGDRKILVRKVNDDDWTTLFEYNTMEEPGVYPWGFDLDPDILYFTRYKDDLLALYKIKLSTGEETLVFADPERDVDGGLIYSAKDQSVMGIYHSNTATGRIYWDDSINRFQRGLDHALSDYDNYLVDFSQDLNTYILYSENDVSPGVYYLGDRKTGQLGLLFEQYPDIDPATLSSHDLVSYKARDGMTIEGYLSVPKNAAEGPYPLVLHPHGGPGARDVDGFDYWTSFFNSRGYAVFRPNFRGSDGYGYEFSQSQMKAWGLEMQDDLTDAVDWLVEEGVADPERVCIVGASYGGYAAAMGVVKTPEKFKCAVSFAGVMNLRRLVMDARQYVGYRLVKNQIGDDRSDLKARSPYYNAEKIRVPVLLIHGEKDLVVDVKQSRMMAEELEDLDKTFEYIELVNGDHYLSIQHNRHITFRAMDKFLAEHLKK